MHCSSSLGGGSSHGLVVSQGGETWHGRLPRVAPIMLRLGVLADGWSGDITPTSVVAHAFFSLVPDPINMYLRRLVFALF